MNDRRIITDFNAFTNESEDVPSKKKANPPVDTEILDKLMELVESEEDVEMCAKEAFEDLETAFKENKVEVKGDEPADKLAMASLIVKLVEKGKLGPEDADSFIEENM